jgi:hypothetical protein
MLSACKPEKPATFGLESRFEEINEGPVWSMGNSTSVYSTQIDPSLRSRGIEAGTSTPFFEPVLVGTLGFSGRLLVRIIFFFT